MSELKDILADTLAFAKRHNLDALSLLSEIAKVTAPEPEPAPEQEKVALPAPTPDEILERVKAYWCNASRKIQGFNATATELYEACGYEFPLRHHSLSYWLTSSPEANAIRIGIRDGLNLYARNNVIIGDRNGRNVIGGIHALDALLKLPPKAELRPPSLSEA